MRGSSTFYTYPRTPFVSTPDSPPPTDKKKDVLCVLKHLEAEIIVGQLEKPSIFFKILQGLNYEPAILELLPTTCGSQIFPSQCLCLFISLSDTAKAFATSDDSVSE